VLKNSDEQMMKHADNEDDEDVEDGLFIQLNHNSARDISE